MEQLPIVRPGERVVARSDGKGGLILGVEKIKGREFAASAECSGYVLDARLLMDVPAFNGDPLVRDLQDSL
ncbi:hypothetical protein SZN_24503, partial [Streptomyces zinciresistens K42]